MELSVRIDFVYLALSIPLCEENLPYSSLITACS